MASRRGHRIVFPLAKRQDYSDPQDAKLHCGVESGSNSAFSDHSYSVSWPGMEEHRDGEPTLGEILIERHMARLQDALKCEREKSTRLQMRCNQQEAELKRREQHSNRLRERLSQLTDTHEERGSSIEMRNPPPVGKWQRDRAIRTGRPNTRREEAALHLMLERREAELREAMKLRHSLATLLHALRMDMEQTLQDIEEDHGEVQFDNAPMVRAELALGDHVTGGVVQGWRKVQRRLEHVRMQGFTALGTDQDKLLSQLETELTESQQLVRLQQQLLQDSFVFSVPSELADSYYLEESERIQARWAELHLQRRTFEKERQSFTDAAIRLSYERQEFKQEKASLMKQQFLCESLLLSKEGHCSHRSESTNLDFSGLEPIITSDGHPITPSSPELQSQQREGTVRVQTPSTPELYSALSLPYSCRATDVGHQLESWNGNVDRKLHTF